MKNFETPIMNITMFETENVVTQASGEVPAPSTELQTKAALSTAIGEAVSEVNTFTFTF